MHRFFLQPYQKHRILLFLGDFLIISAGFTLISYGKPSLPDEIAKFYIVTLIMCILTVFIFYILDLYDLSKPKGSAIILFSVCIALSIVLLCYSALSYFIIPLRPGKINLLFIILVNSILTLVWHVYFQRIIKIKPQRLLFIGKEPIFDEVLHVIQDQYIRYYEVVDHWYSDHSALPNLTEFVQDNDIDIVVYSVYSNLLKEISNDMITIKFSNKNIIDAYNFYQRVTYKYPVYFLDNFWLLINAQREILFPAIGNNLKRAFDIVFALFLGLLALPICLLTALAIKLESAGPALFIQERLGQNGVPFRLFKFRTMVQNAEQDGPRWCTENDTRITRSGKILRKLRLDELPQFLNVLKGEMSLVGPRPIRQHFTDMLSEKVPFYKIRLLVKPGLTGWAQIYSGHAHTTEGHSQMLQYDLFYLVHQSFWLDTFILFKTVKVMIWGKGT
jgi:exopolysaccharide biosynthesis polyprenyl glycosylphosphotransferase